MMLPIVIVCFAVRLFIAGRQEWWRRLPAEAVVKFVGQLVLGWWQWYSARCWLRTSLRRGKLRRVKTSRDLQSCRSLSTQQTWKSRTRTAAATRRPAMEPMEAGCWMSCSWSKSSYSSSSSPFSCYPPAPSSSALSRSSTPKRTNTEPWLFRTFKAKLKCVKVRKLSEK